MDTSIKYARREPTIDRSHNKRWPKLPRFDVQLYDDPACTQPGARFMWNQKRPKRDAKTVMLNNGRYKLVWVANTGGFTLIELMIVVAVLGLLVAIAVPKFAKAINKSYEAMTLGNLAAMRASINSYMAAHEGVYPTDDLTSLITEGYLSEIPTVRVPPNGDGVFAGHSPGNSVGAGNRAAWGPSTTKWFYFNDRTELQWWGKIVVNCGHPNSRGVPWDEN